MCTFYTGEGEKGETRRARTRLFCITNANNALKNNE